MQLLTNITATTSLPANIDPIAFSNNPTNSVAAFVAKGEGEGEGTWSATVEIYPVFLDTFGATSNYYTATPITLSLTDAAPVATSTVSTPIDNYIAIVSALTGTVAVSAQVIL